ncbi:hypothetical protein DFP72DRAFT_1169757 [Ephemerocybe angulata]|uniref:MYND-type domain-containing protein n=1 Tax=Ephemerocybe angulata TaxID=980116 RepID=A0A8H6I0C7_9AGAR|nr:hypothetical protein DFP72DRAFT_1169757 [Tulosesus angulatus]
MPAGRNRKVGAAIQAPPQASRMQMNKRRMLFDQVSETATSTSRSTAALTALAKFLSEEQDLEWLEHILRSLDASQIPTVAFVNFTNDDRKRCQSAKSQLADLTSALLSFRWMESSGVPTEGARLLIDYWDSITKWMRYLILLSRSQSPERLTMLGYTAKILLSIAVHIPESDEGRLGLMTLSQTSDLIIFLLTHTDKATGEHYNDFSLPGEPCRLVRVFYGWTNSEDVWISITARIASFSLRSRRAIMDSILARAKEIDGRHRSGSVGGLCAVKTFFFLSGFAIRLLAWSRLWPAKVVSVFLEVFAQTLRSIRDRFAEDPSGIDGWSELSKCTIALIKVATSLSSNPTNALKYLIRGGILPCIVGNVPRVESLLGPSEAVQTLELMLPYVYHSRVFWAMTKNDDHALFRRPIGDSLEADAIRRTIADWSERDTLAYAGKNVDGGPTMACSNIKHWDTSSHSVRQALTPKRCSRCRVAIYCSQACQEEDWNAYHSQDCRPLAQWYSGLEEIYTSLISFEARIDQLRHMELQANLHLPRPPLSKIPTPGIPRVSSQALPDSSGEPYTCHPGSMIAWWDVVLGTDVRLVPLASYQEAAWQSPDGKVDPRLTGCVKEMEADPGRSILMEGVFPFISGEELIYVTVVMKWLSLGGQEAHYRIVTNVIRAV